MQEGRILTAGISLRRAEAGARQAVLRPLGPDGGRAPEGVRHCWGRDPLRLRGGLPAPRHSSYCNKRHDIH